MKGARSSSLRGGGQALGPGVSSARPLGRRGAALVASRAASTSSRGANDGRPKRLVIYNNSESVQDVQERTGIPLEKLLRANNGRRELGDRHVLVVDEGSAAPASTSARARDGLLSGGLLVGALSLPVIMVMVALGRRKGKGTESLESWKAPAARSGDARGLDVEAFDVSELDLSGDAGPDFWKDLPFVCVLLLDGSQWFSVGMGEGGAGENRILGFESAEDANRMRYFVSNDPAYAAKRPRVQVVSPQDLCHASHVLETEVFVVPAGQPSSARSLDEGVSEIYETYHRGKLGLRRTSSSK
ncbi:hypothetical protein HOP50_02g13740 [Chloropicon primus]|nr:hypothetical protein HOP50_02g13740 [Chloropicon primus]